MREYLDCSDQRRAKFWNEVDRYPDAEPPVEVKAALLARFRRFVEGNVAEFSNLIG